MLGDLLRERDELKAAQQQNIELMELFPMHLTKDCETVRKMRVVNVRRCYMLLFQGYMWYVARHN